MATILDRIVAQKRAELAASKEQVPLRDLEQAVMQAPPPRGFAAALMKPAGVQVIAEIKRASPAAGKLSDARDVTGIARLYAANGAACISVLTDQPFFHGALRDLVAIREHVDLPLLRKDFILDRYQLLEGRVAGADAVLLIAEILDDQQLKHLLAESHQLGMAALVECYETSNLERVVALGATIIGINNRNLHTFTTSLDHTIKLASRIPPDRCLVSESGINSRTHVQNLYAAGVKAILVGEALMRASDIPAKLADLCNVGNEKS